MSDMNMANRQCCDLDIRNYADKSPFLYADFCNTTTAGFSSDAVYAMKNGAKCIKFDNPLDGTITMEFQVHPFKIYSFLSDGVIETNAIVSQKEEIKATEAGKLTITGTPDANSVFVMDMDGNILEGATVSAKVVSCTSVKSGSTYKVCYLETKAEGVKKVSFNNKKVPKYFWIQMSTLDKAEDGSLVPVRITAYKATPQRNLELSFSSEGDPASITLTIDCLEDKDGNVLDIVEIEE